LVIRPKAFGGSLQSVAAGCYASPARTALYPSGASSRLFTVVFSAKPSDQRLQNADYYRLTEPFRQTLSLQPRGD